MATWRARGFRYDGIEKLINDGVSSGEVDKTEYEIAAGKLNAEDRLVPHQVLSRQFQ